MIKKSLIMLILFSVTSIFFAGVGLLIFPDPGEVYGIIVSIIVLIIIIIAADKLILGAVHAKSTQIPHKIKEVVANYACRFGVNKVNVYSTQIYVNNIYFASSIFGTPSIIIGKNLFKNISDEELEVLIIASLWNIQSGTAAFKTFCTLVLGIYNLPLLLVKARSPHSESKFNSLIHYFLFPLSIVKYIIFKSQKTEILGDHKIFKLGSSKEAFSSAIFKLSLMEQAHVGAFSSSIVENLSIADNKSNEMMGALSFLGFNVEEKYSNIMS